MIGANRLKIIDFMLNATDACGFLPIGAPQGFLSDCKRHSEWHLINGETKDLAFRILLPRTVSLRAWTAARSQLATALTHESLR